MYLVSLLIKQYKLYAKARVYSIKFEEHEEVYQLSLK